MLEISHESVSFKTKGNSTFTKLAAGFGYDLSV
jgi:hypothetical protein